MNVSGHVRERTNSSGNKVWQLIVELPPDGVTGKRRRKCKTIECGGKKEAEKALRKLLSLYDTGDTLGDVTITLGDWITRWMKLYKEQYLSPTTYDSYKRNIKLHVLPAFGSCQLSEITTNDIQLFVNTLSRDHSPKTIRNIFNNLSDCFEKAVALDMITKNPCKYATLPKLQQKYTPASYTPEETEKLICYAKGTDMFVPIAIEITCGLRRGELLALRWDSVDLENKTIHICENLVTVNGKKIIKSPKTKNSVRVIDIPDELVEILREHRENQKKHLHRSADRMDYVVCTKDGEPYSAAAMTKKWRRFIIRYKDIRDLRFHDLRHTCASLLFDADVNAKVIQNRLGHSNVQVTLDIYTHAMPAAQKEAAQTIGKIVLGK